MSMNHSRPPYDLTSRQQAAALIVAVCFIAALIAGVGRFLGAW